MTFDDFARSTTRRGVLAAAAGALAADLAFLTAP